MWPRFRSASKITRESNKDEPQNGGRSLNLNEEYLNTLRTKSYADFFTKAQTLVTDSNSDNPSYSFHHSFILLEPGQFEASAAILESAALSGKPDLKALMLDYFDISAEASRICSHLLASINQIQSNHRPNISTDDFSQSHLESIRSHLESFSILHNPFSDPESFVAIRERYSSVLRRLRAKSKQVGRKIRLIRWTRKSAAICGTAACGAVAIGGLVLAAHTVAALVMAPPILLFPARGFRRRGWGKLPLLGCGTLVRVGEQLEAAAKGAYIQNRDFETMSRLVRRLRDEVEHGEGMLERCMEMRRGREDRVSGLREVVRELRKSGDGLRERVEELEEHVYLSLVTINRARALVMKEMTTMTAASCDRHVAITARM